MPKDDFLQQNNYSNYEICSLRKTKYIIKAFMGFYDEAQKAVSEGLSWAKIRENTSDIQYGSRSMKIQLPNNEEGVSRKYEILLQKM